MSNQLIKDFGKIENIFKNIRLGDLTKNFLKNIFLVLINKSPRIKWLVYEVTDACNYRCRHCQIWKHKPSPDMLTAEDLGGILKDDFFEGLKVIRTGW